MFKFLAQLFHYRAESTFSDSARMRRRENVVGTSFLNRLQLGISQESSNTERCWKSQYRQIFRQSHACILVYNNSLDSGQRFNYIWIMQASVAELKAHLSKVLSKVEKGEKCLVLKHNKPIAEVVPVRNRQRNRTRIGCAVGTAKIHGDLTEPLIPEEDWDMLTGR